MKEWTKEMQQEFCAFYKGKKVLVTGHTGFKGAWLTRMLTNAGAVVTGYSLEPPTDPSLFYVAGLHNTMDSVIGDIRADFDETLKKCVRMSMESYESLPLMHRFWGRTLRLIAPLM